VKIIFAISLALALAGCDDESPTAALLGGGPGGSYSSSYAIVPQTSGGIPDGYVAGQPITTMSSEFGYVDDPAHGGSGDPGTTGNWYTGAGGQWIGGQDSNGISLPAATEIAIYGSTQAAQNQPVQVVDTTTGNSVVTTIVDVGPGSAAISRGVGVDLTWGTARALGAPVNGSNSMQVIPLTSKSF
jgi:hypothetical protein